MQNPKPSDTFELVTVASGARSLRSLEHGETFHPVVGPMAEARGLHVAQQSMAERARSNGRPPFVVWDVGLGAAANAIAALEALSTIDAGGELHSFDGTLAPLEFALKHARELGYLEGWEAPIAELLRNGRTRHARIDWQIHPGDFRELLHDSSISSPHAVMFDPYSPTANPELWNLETFAAIRARAGDGNCTLTSYSRSTAVRTTLLLAGWFVGRGGATGEKTETTVAATHRGLLTRPLEPKWLDRVRRSTAAGPLTHSCGQTRTGPQVATELAEHPQFQNG